uniref:Uncharacterized protein n=2 Tax=Candidatus Kentrum sp. LPFa TaxID=2126335 RepID=A0A450WBS6_9GAMM|nr:MAG: hypothetical protein BECKLPF1236B_GA0070989_10637 [Candidatus Kentron sp. LPFa]
MKQQPRFGAVGWIATRIHHLFLPVDALRLSTLRGHVFHLLGDETLNMIVTYERTLRSGHGNPSPKPALKNADAVRLARCTSRLATQR